MDRLSIVLTLMTGAVLAGGLTILAFASGWYGWTPIVAAAIVGFSLAWPAAYVISRRIKREDPHFRDDRASEYKGRLPDPRAREV